MRMRGWEMERWRKIPLPTTHTHTHTNPPSLTVSGEPPSSPSPKPIVFPLHLLPPSIHLHILGVLLSDITNLSAASGSIMNVKWRVGSVQIVAKYITGILHLRKTAVVWTGFISVVSEVNSLMKEICFRTEVTVTREKYFYSALFVFRLRNILESNPISIILATLLLEARPSDHSHCGCKGYSR